MNTGSASGADPRQLSEMETRLLLKIERRRVIDDLFDALTTSSFAEGCEAKIARGLEARTDAQLIALANEKGIWTPKS